MDHRTIIAQLDTLDMVKLVPGAHRLSKWSLSTTKIKSMQWWKHKVCTFVINIYKYVKMEINGKISTLIPKAGRNAESWELIQDKALMSKVHCFCDLIAPDIHTKLRNVCVRVHHTMRRHLQVHKPVTGRLNWATWSATRCHPHLPWLLEPNTHREQT